MSRIGNMIVTWSLAASLCAACGTSLVGPDEVSDDSADSFGLVVVTLAENREHSRTREEIFAQAWFVEHVGYNQVEVLDLIQPPSSLAPDLALGQCAVHEDELLIDGYPSDSVERSIYFMDAGDVRVAGGQHTLAMDGSYFPDVRPDVGGLIYEGVYHHGKAIAAPGALQVSGFGSPEVGTFDVSLALPAPLYLTSVGDQRVRGSRISGPARDQGLELTWVTADGAAPSGEPVFVELVRREFDQSARLVCLVPDTGHFVIPAEELTLLPDMGVDQTDWLSVFRVHDSSFEAEGLSTGWLLLVTRDEVLLD